ncbi:MAG: hypothetical protein HFI08_03230 [Bacilli bacterium]|nr:hypothetical protein [Bacilli bacterium]
MKIINKKIFSKEELPSNCKLKKLIFLRIDPEDRKEVLKHIYQELADNSWTKRFNKSIIRDSYNKRIEKTLNSLEASLKIGEDNKITRESGEYLVSELSREVIINELNYSNIPLAELRKEQVKSNPGFDFHSESDNKIIIFGEAKYSCRDNAYNSALSQIVDFIKNEKDLAEIADLEEFVSDEALINFEKENKGYAAAFSSHAISSEQLINNILKNENCLQLYNYNELLLLAVDVND